MQASNRVRNSELTLTQLPFVLNLGKKNTPILPIQLFEDMYYTK